MMNFKRFSKSIIVTLYSLANSAFANEEPKPDVPNEPSNVAPLVTFYAPEGMVPTQVLQQFTLQTGIQVKQQFSDPQSTLTTLNDSAQQPTDVALLPYSQWPKAEAFDATFESIDSDKVPNAALVNPLLLSNKVASRTAYSVPLMIEGFGIATSTQMLPSSLLDMWQDLVDAQWSRQLLLPDDPQTLVAIALINLGYSINNPTNTELQEAKEWLLELEPNLAILTDHDPEMHFLSGQISIGILSNREVYIGNQEGGNLDVVWPSEGAVLEIYALSIAKTSEQSKNAHQLINFLLERSNQLKIATHSGLTPSTYDERLNKSAVVAIPDNVIANGQFKLNNPDTRLKYEYTFQQFKGHLTTQQFVN